MSVAFLLFKILLFLVCLKPILAWSADALHSRGDEHVRLMSCQHSIRHMSAMTDVQRPISPSLLCSLCFTNCKHTLTATHANRSHANTRTLIHSCTQMYTPLPHTDSWGVTLLAQRPERNTEGDGQAGAVSEDAGTRSQLLTSNNEAHVKRQPGSN